MPAAIRAGLLALLLAAACGTETPASAAHPASTGSPQATPSPVVTPVPAGFGTVAARCDSTPPRDHPLALTGGGGGSEVRLVDMQDPTQARTLCALTVSNASGLRFINPGELSYVALAGSGQDAAGGLVRLNLATGATGLLARWDQSHFGAGLHAWTPDGKALAYIASTGSTLQLHQVTAAGDRVLTSLPAVPGRGTSEEDSILIAYSPDGQFLAFVNTFTGSGTGEHAKLQIRRLDGSLAFATAGGTQATWAGSGATLLWRDVASGPSSPPIQKWTAAGAATAVPALRWLRPSASPDGRYIVYTVRRSTASLTPASTTSRQVHPRSTPTTAPRPSS
jgi:hypothetical protein